MELIEKSFFWDNGRNYLLEGTQCSYYWTATVLRMRETAGFGHCSKGACWKAFLLGVRVTPMLRIHRGGVHEVELWKEIFWRSKESKLVMLSLMDRWDGLLRYNSWFWDNTLQDWGAMPQNKICLWSVVSHYLYQLGIPTQEWENSCCHKVL